MSHAFITRRGVSGGGSAKLNVVKVSAKPTSSAPIGTVAVETTTDITDVVYSNIKPTGTNGMVWLRCGHSATQSISLSENPIISLPVTTVMQYEGDVWAYKKAYIYNGITWNLTRLILYELGEGADNFDVRSNRTSAGVPGDTYSFSPTLTATRSGSTDGGQYAGGTAFITKNPIVLSGYSRLCVTISGNGHTANEIGFGLCELHDITPTNSASIISGSDPYNSSPSYTESLQTIDIPNGIVSKYVYVKGSSQFPYSAYGSGSYTFYVKEIYAE